ncbi:MAG: tetratricopeptide repeat protein [Pseudomonadota bacterium]
MIEIPREKLVVMMEAGYLFLGMQRYKEAHQVFEGVAALSPDSEVPVVALGSLAFCLGKFNDAIKLYDKALKIDPNSLFAKVYMAETLFFSGKPDKAKKLLVEVSTHDRHGAAGDFARALKDAIDDGFTPESLEGHAVKKGKGNVKTKKTRKIRS